MNDEGTTIFTVEASVRVRVEVGTSDPELARRLVQEELIDSQYGRKSAMFLVDVEEPSLEYLRITGVGETAA